MSQSLDQISEVSVMSESQTALIDATPLFRKWWNIRSLFHKAYFLSPLILQKIIWIPTRFVLFFFGHLEISGLENIKNVKDRVIFACNHTSEMDPFFVPASLPFFSRHSPIFYTSRERAFYKNSGWRQNFYGGLFFKIWGAYPVKVGLKDYEKSLENQIAIIEDGGRLCFFPEGKTTPDGNIQIAKGGVAYLAHRTHAVIVPVRIRGVFHFRFKDFLLRRLKLSVSYGKPMTISGTRNTTLSLADFKMYANCVMEEVGKL